MVRFLVIEISTGRRAGSFRKRAAAEAYMLAVPAIRRHRFKIERIFI